MVTCPAFFAFIVSFDNLTDYNTNFEFAMCSAWTRLFQAIGCSTAADLPGAVSAAE
jgi:predicted small integral membrane protein